MMTVEMEQMNHQNIANQKVEHVSVIFSPATTGIAFRAYTFVVRLNLTGNIIFHKL